MHRQHHPNGNCNRQILRRLDPDLYAFAQEVRTALRTATDGAFFQPAAESDDRIIRIWIGTLGPLAHDVAGSILLLLSHGELRAPAILNRCIFEYQLRLRYYIIKPEKAREALVQMPERFRKILRADPTGVKHFSDADRAAFEAWLQQRETIERESIKNDLFVAVYGKNTDRLYDGYYGKISGHVHGYETVVRDVHRAYYNNEPNPKPDYHTRVFNANDIGATMVTNLLDMVRAIVQETQVDFGYTKLQERWNVMSPRIQETIPS